MRSCNEHAPLIIQEGDASPGLKPSRAESGHPLTQQFLSTEWEEEMFEERKKG
jgi:hypothetical protein